MDSQLMPPIRPWVFTMGTGSTVADMRSQRLQIDSKVVPQQELS
jgi:hypothetical protein